MSEEKIIGWTTEEFMICPRCKQKYGKSNLAFQDKPIYYGCGCMEDDKMYFINTENIEIDTTPNCPCHNQPCVWTSYNQALWNEPKQDHYSCAVTKEKVDV